MCVCACVCVRVPCLATRTTCFLAPYPSGRGVWEQKAFIPPPPKFPLSRFLFGTFTHMYLCTCECVYRHTNKKGDVRKCNVYVRVCTCVCMRVKQQGVSALAKLLEEARQELRQLQNDDSLSQGIVFLSPPTTSPHPSSTRRRQRENTSRKLIFALFISLFLARARALSVRMQRNRFPHCHQTDPAARSSSG